MAYCPECGTRIGKTAKFCRECGCDLAVDTQQALPQVGSEQKCAIHPKMNSIGVCDKCGTAVCVICKSEVKDKLYCPDCVDDVTQIQRDLDWLQNFREQYEEVVRLRLEMQDVAKRILLTSQESENKPASGIREQLKELQREFANIEKSLISGPKPKSSDLRKMSLSLKDACMYLGIACVAYRKWAEKPSSSIEAYTDERLKRASEAVNRIKEQLTQFSIKSEYMQRAMTSNDSKKVIFGLEQASQTTKITDDVFTNKSVLRIMRGSGFIRKEGAKSIIFGFLMLIVGGIVTHFTYSLASGGGIFIVTTGLFIGGLTAIIKGLYHLLRG